MRGIGRAGLWLVVMSGAGALAGCASSSRTGECDDPNNCVDAPGPTPDAADVLYDAGPDAPPLLGFGEPCTDRDQCQSNLCILIGTSGQCTQFCPPCPDGYGCLGVTGVDVDGQISFVCVPLSNQLCSPCVADSECTLVGADKCLTYPDGDQYCARDCSTITCPDGFECETVDVGGDDFEQCVPVSGACDCTAANPGQTQPCNIVTPWNVCEGAQTCGGDAGWGECAPPSDTDDPDDGFVDSNCDGIDGEMTRGIFVSPAGANTGTCGQTYMTPCLTITYGIGRAAASGRTEVYVQAGTYNEVVVMSNAIDVWTSTGSAGRTRARATASPSTARSTTGSAATTST
jgi:hypothetical protein